MISLRDLVIDDGYRSGQASMLKHLYLPCLQVAISYDRSVGFFSSSALCLALAGISALVRSGGTIRIVASPHLSETDLEQITNGYDQRTLDAALVTQTKAIVAELSIPQIKLLAWLIAAKKLDIKLAMIKNGATSAIYHEKRGIFRDRDDNVITFVGSANETAAALMSHFESVEVFRSWKEGEQQRTARHVEEFERLWGGEEPLLTVRPFPSAAADVIVNSASFVAADEPLDLAAFDHTISAFHTSEPAPDLRGYQLDAVRAWLKNNGRGIFQMATGTGKTITALAAAEIISKDYRARKAQLAIVIVVPLQDLVLQWDVSARRFGFTPILCYDSREVWSTRLATQAVLQRNGDLDAPLVIITTNSTYLSSGFQDALERITGDLFFIIDEVHNMGAERNRELLNERAQLRLGLSATPERWHDSVGTQAITAYFDSVVYRLDLADAIAMKALTPYRYYVHPVILEEDETIEYLRLTEKLRRAGGYADVSGDDQKDIYLKRLLIARAKLIGNARQKVPLLKTLIMSDTPASHTLIYCGTGSSEDEKGEAIRSVDHVANSVRSCGVTVATYTSRTARDDRTLLQEAFAEGSIQYLAAIRCLDEGIDIPATRRAYFLASSSNPRQFIQRRGRILRRFEGKERAEVHDMLTLLDSNVQGVSPSLEESSAKREMERIRTFAETAENGPRVIADLLEMVPGGANVVI